MRHAPVTSEFKLHCASDPAVTHGVNLDGRFDDAGNGRIRWLNLGAAGQLRNVLLEGGGARRVGSEYILRGNPKRNGLAARLPDGRALAAIEIRWPAGAQGEKLTKSAAVHVETVVVDDFAPVHQAVRRLAVKQPALFDNGPLMRATFLRALFSELGMAERSWCCVDDGNMPPATRDAPVVSASAVANRELQPFFHYCAICHLTRERFPPNFLSGEATQVVENLRRCAPRMLVRLSAWRTPVEQRVKSPMPPATSVQAMGIATERWAGSEELEVLRAYVEGLSRREDQPADIGDLSKGSYEALPSCLPEAVGPVKEHGQALGIRGNVRRFE